MDNFNVFENQFAEDNFLGVESFSEAPVMSLDEMYGLLNQVQERAFLSLQEFAATDDFAAKMASVFGEGNDYSAWQTAFATSTFTDFPTIEILSGSVLQGANAAYAGSTNTIYFSQDFLAQYANNSQALTAVFLEEFGHHVDWQVNAGVDTPGDEGYLFSLIIQEAFRNELDYQLSQQENDHSLLPILDDLVALELNSESIDRNQLMRDFQYKSALLFREYKEGFIDNIPGIDHVALLYENRVYESVSGYASGDYWDPLQIVPYSLDGYDKYGPKVKVELFNGVQNYHTLGSWAHGTKTRDASSNYVEFRALEIDSHLASEMASFIQEKLNVSPYQSFIPWLNNLAAFPQKGGFDEDKFTCVGLIEWAAEKAGHNSGQGFIPNFFEYVNISGAPLPILLTPELLYKHASDTTFADKISEFAEQFQAWGAYYTQGGYAQDLGEALLDMAYGPLRPRYFNGFIDPVDFILTDPLGRRLGHNSILGTINEIPDSIYTGDGIVESFIILDPLPGAYSIELFGLGENALAAIGNQLGGFLFNEFLAFGDRSFATFTIRESSENGHGISGGKGNEKLSGSVGNDTLYGGAGNDVLSSGTGDDKLYGGTGLDTLQAGSGDDYLQGDGGEDRIDGADGTDTVSYISSPHGVIANINQSVDYHHLQYQHIFDLERSFSIDAGKAKDGFGSEDYLTNLESIIGSDFDDVLIGNLSSNRLQGGNGSDLLISSGGNDQLEGGLGIDSVSYRRDPNGVQVNLKDGIAFDGYGSQDLVSDIENIVGSLFNDVLYGDGEENTITGGDGDDLIDAGDGQDIVYGENGNDTISGGLGNDNIQGNDGTDTINGDDGNDTISGGNDNDTIAGDAGDDTITGDAGNDRISGGLGNDGIQGNDGTDTINGNDGNDTISGGLDNDTIAGDAGDDAITGDAGDDTISGGLGNDGIQGNDGTDTINGNDGNDTISGGLDNDTIAGDAGDDAITGDAGDDTISGGLGNDGIQGNEGADRISGGLGNDGIQGNDGTDTINGDDGNDTISGGLDNDTIAGDAGDDTITGDNGDDRISGGLGNDNIQGNNGADTINGNDGNDTISGGLDNDTIAGDAGDDTITGDNGDDRISGGLGNDNIQGNNGADTINGDDGNDTISGGNDDDLIYGDSGNDHLYGDAGNDTLYGGTGNDNLRGGTGNDNLYGEAGNDNLYGDDGDDYMVGGPGMDFFDGGNGEDLISFKDAPSAVAFSLKAGGWQGEAMGDRVTNVENLEGSLFSDYLIGNDFNNKIYGLAGDDTIEGYDGNDWLYGGLGNDILRGGQGADILWGDEGNNYLDGGLGNDILHGGTGNNRLDAGEGNNIITAGDGNNLVYAGPGHDTITLGNGNNQIYAGEGQNVITVGRGDNLIYGGASADIITVGDGNNRIYAAEGNNVITVNGFGVNTIDTTYGDDLVYGGAGNDRIVTRGGNDTIYAAEGNNYIDAGDGINTIFSGSGADTFVLGWGSQNTIMQFDVGYDKLGLSNGLQFGQLNISQGSTNGQFFTQIKLAWANTPLAILNWTQASEIDSSSFVNV